jgi:4-amino-4-deoxy-L-arabinose transferase-like glycosyltransferase
MAVMLPVAASGEHAALVMHLLHGLLGGLAACLTVVLARRTGLGGRASFLAGGLVAFWPFLIWETKVSVPENLLVALVPGVLLAFVLWHQGNGVGWAALAGALAGWATLTHGLYQVLLPVLLVAVLSVGVPWRRRLAGAAALALAAAAVVTPWTLHTSDAAGRWIGLATGFGHHYLKGLRTFDLLARPGDYFTDIEGMLWKEMRSLVAREGFDSRDDTLIRSDPAINRRLDELARADLNARPVAAALRTAVRVPLFWVQQQSVLRAVLTAALLAPLFSLAIRGLRRSGRASDWTAAAMLLAINLAAAAVFIEARPMRYALPLIPLLAVLAARGLDKPEDS